jgi:hypothetical protein
MLLKLIAFGALLLAITFFCVLGANAPHKICLEIGRYPLSINMCLHFKTP